MGSLKVWPNPTNGILNIQMSDSNSPANDIKVFDVFGKLVDMLGVCDAPQQSAQIDLSRHPDGVYFVQTGDGAVTKVVVSR